MQFCDIEISVYYLISCASRVLIDDRIYPVIPRPCRFPDVGEQSLASQFENSDERVAELNNRVQAISVREEINHAILGD